jgi:O-antigen/teichoic acid export membrane protein
MSEDSEIESVSSLKSVAEGAGLFFIGRIFSNAVGFLVNLALTRSLGVGLYGMFSYLNAIFSVLYVITELGGDKSLMRFLPEYEENRKKQNIMITTAYFTSLFISLALAVVVYYIAPYIAEYTIDDPVFVDVLQLTVIIIPFNTLSNITLSIFKSIERMDYNVQVSSVLNPIVRLIFIGGAVLLGYSITGAAVGLIITSIIVFTAGILILITKTDLGRLRRPTMNQAKEYYNFSVPLTLAKSGSILYKRVDVLMVGFLLSSVAVGIYNLAVILSTIIALPLTGFQQLFPPIASRLYNNDKYDKLENTYSTVTRWIFTFAFFPSLFAISFSKEILQVFGEGFAEGSTVLSLFILAQLVNSAVGPTGYLLVMADHQYLDMINKLTAGIINIGLNYTLTIQYGLIGAAIATAGTLTAVNLARVVQVVYYENMIPYDMKYIKPLSAGIISYGTLYVSSQALAGYMLLVVGGILGGLSFVAVLLALGFEQQDIDILKSLLPTG